MFVSETCRPSLLCVTKQSGNAVVKKEETGGGIGGGGGGEGWERGRKAGVGPKPAPHSEKSGYLEGGRCEKEKPFWDEMAEAEVDSCTERRGVRWAGRGGGVGGKGVAVRDRVGVGADGSSVRESHSLVTGCRSSVLWEGGGERRSGVVKDGGR